MRTGGAKVRHYRMRYGEIPIAPWAVAFSIVELESSPCGVGPGAAPGGGGNAVIGAWRNHGEIYEVRQYDATKVDHHTQGSLFSSVERDPGRRVDDKEPQPPSIDYCESSSNRGRRGAKFRSRL